VGGLVTGAVVAAALAYPPQKLRTQISAAVVVALLALFTLAVVVQTHAIQAQGIHPA
jgi:hypothetical protein